jgi:hypothetical protein
MPVVSECVGNTPIFGFGYQWFLGNFQLVSTVTGARVRAGVQLGYLRLGQEPNNVSSQVYFAEHALALVHADSGKPSTYSQVTQFLGPDDVSFSTMPFLVQFRDGKSSSTFQSTGDGIPGQPNTTYLASATYMDQFNVNISMQFTLVDRQGYMFENKNGLLSIKGPLNIYWFRFPDLQVMDGWLSYGNETFSINATSSSGGIGFFMQPGPTRVREDWDWYPVQIKEVNGIMLETPICFDIFHCRNNRTFAPEWSYGSLLCGRETVILNASTGFTVDIVKYGKTGWPCVTVIAIPLLELNVTITNIIEDATFGLTGPEYMEIGADVVGWMAGKEVKGYAYSEHSGY